MHMSQYTITSIQNSRHNNCHNVIIIFFFRCCTGISVGVSVLVTVVLMCIREANKKAADDLDKDELLLEEIDSLDALADM